MLIHFCQFCLEKKKWKTFFRFNWPNINYTNLSISFLERPQFFFFFFFYRRYTIFSCLLNSFFLSGLELYDTLLNFHVWLLHIAISKRKPLVYDVYEYNSIYLSFWSTLGKVKSVPIDMIDSLMNNSEREHSLRRNCWMKFSSAARKRGKIEWLGRKKVASS